MDVVRGLCVQPVDARLHERGSFFLGIELLATELGGSLERRIGVVGPVTLEVGLPRGRCGCVGGGIGALDLAFLAHGATRATLIDGSAGFVDAAREEAARTGGEDRLDIRLGDFVRLAPGIEPADVLPYFSRLL